MKRSSGMSLSRSVIILLILVLSVGLGFLFDFVCTCVEKAIHPQNYQAYVELYAEQFDVPPHLVYAVIKCESGFDAGAESSAGAIGLMQLVPDTFSDVTKALGEPTDYRAMYDPETNIRCGTYYLSRMYRQFGSWEMALIAYNAGPGNASKWLSDPQLADGEGGLKDIPFKETKAYVSKVQKAWARYDRLYDLPPTVLAPESATQNENH